MRQKTYLLIVSLIFSVVSILHLLRFLFRRNIAIDSWIVPLWPSLVGFIITGFLAYYGFRLSGKS